MKKILFFVILCVPYLLMGQLLSAPESVVYDATNNRYLVSNVNTGNIVEINDVGVMSNFSTDQPSIRGIHIRDNFLFTSGDIGVRCYSLANDVALWTAQLPGSMFPNDITSDNNGFLYVSDNAANRIYRVNIASQVADVFVQGTINAPNGLFFEEENNRLIVVSFAGNSAVRAVDLDTANVTIITNTNLSNLDGIARDSQGNYYISSWGSGAIHLFSPDFSGTSEVFSTGHQGPADIFFDAVNSVLAVPNFQANTVDFLPAGEQVPGVELEAFIPIYNNADENVIITWTTSYENSLIGFNIYRAIENDFDEALLVNGFGFIEALNSQNGATYELIDENIEFETEYFYWLEAVQIDGISEIHGPATVQTPQDPNPFTVTSFSGVYLNENEHIEIAWSTINESELAGFNIWKNTSENMEEASRLNNLLIVPSNTPEEQNYLLADEEVQNNSTYYYWLELVELDGFPYMYEENITVMTPVGNTSDNNASELVNNSFAYPNPFNPQTTINFFTKNENAKTSLKIFNSRGQIVKILTNGFLSKGEHSIIWNGTDSNEKELSSGIYYFQISNGSHKISQKLTLLK